MVMNRSLLYILLCACAGVLLFSCNTSGDAVPPKQDPDYPNLDKFQELVDACNNWKSGGGAATTGGQNAYAVYHVTSLEDKRPSVLVPGTFRHAVCQTGTRIVVFDVAGTIHLSGPLPIVNGNLSIFGQTAPGDGICIADYPVKIANTSNIIMQFIRIRMGDEKLTPEQADAGDALFVENCTNVLIDHCSFSWSTDECVSCYGNENFTLQYCFITESLRRAKKDDEGQYTINHAFGGMWGGKNVTFHHNLLAHHDNRCPRFDHDYVNNKCYGPIDYVNNVVYNWGSNSSYGGESVSKSRCINMVNNYYKYGPASASSSKARLLLMTSYCTNCVKSGIVTPGKYYIDGNYMDGSATVTDDNWKGVTCDSKNKITVTDYKVSTPFAMNHEITKQTAEEAYTTVLAKSGCSLSRDDVDTRIVDEVRNRKVTYNTGSRGSEKGLIDTPMDVGGWPELTGEKLEDSDEDGMPDEWEEKYGLDPFDESDCTIKSLVSGYPNIEVYAQSLVAEKY